MHSSEIRKYRAVDNAITKGTYGHQITLVIHQML